MSGAVSERVSARAYFAAWAIVRWLPESLAYSLFYFGARLLGRKQPKSVRRLRSNLERVAGNSTEAEMEALLLASLKSYMRYWCDTFRFPDWSKERIRSTVTVRNEHLLMDAIEAGTGVIVSLPHAGNWDHAGAYFCGKGVPLVTVAERLKPEALFLKFLEYRQSIGMEVLPLDTRSLAILAQRLRSGALIALVADRDLSRSGITVDFFGAHARMPAGPALLAINTGAPLITAFVSYTDAGIHIDFNPIEIPSTGSKDEKIAVIVQECANNFAQGISQTPQDWHMLQRIWVDEDFMEREDA